MQRHLIIGAVFLNTAVWLLPQATIARSPALEFRETRRFPAKDAHQAAAVDATSFFAITSRGLSKHNKSDGKQTAQWQAQAGSHIKHLNSGVVIDGRLLCANSNWPASPLKNSIEVFDAKTLKHLETRRFPETEGAINWVDRYRDAWWVVFAFYGEAEVRRTQLVQYDDQWNVVERWSFPETVIQRFLPNSNSGGAFGPNGRLFVTGHDHAETYVLAPPQSGKPLRHLATVAASIAGQGVAWDRYDIGTMWGVVRKNREVVSMRLTHAVERLPLQRRVTWTRDSRNPILPPVAGTFDATRCMNPWVVRDGSTYRLYYSGGDQQGKQRIGVATADVNDLSRWTRSGPLFETGAAGAFDARWCVLPHVTRFSNEWRLYYTGNAGRGSGLAAFPGIGFASSLDGKAWRRNDSSPVLGPSNRGGEPDAIGIAGGSVLKVGGDDGAPLWRFYYTGCPTVGSPLKLNQQKTICLAESRDGVTWIKRGAVMLRDPRRDYEDVGVAGPVVLRDNDGLYRMWYSAIGTRWGYYSICYAESEDGVHWRRGAKSGDNLQLTPTGAGWEKQMVEYPSIIREGDRLRMFYCGNGYGRTGIGMAVSQPIRP